MKMDQASVGSLQRIVALLLLCAVLFGAYLLIDRVWLGKYRYYQNNIAEMQNRLQRFQAISAQREVLEAQLQRVRQDSSVDEFYLQKSSTMLAASDLQQRVKTAIESLGGALVSTQVLPVTTEGTFSRVAIRAQMTADTEILQRLVHDLEASRPLLFIDELQVRSQPIRRRDPNDRGKTLVETRLTIQFELSGYIRRGDNDAA